MEGDRTTSPQKVEKPDPRQVHHSHTQTETQPNKDNTDITLTTSQVPAPSLRVPVIHLLSAEKQTASI